MPENVGNNKKTTGKQLGGITGKGFMPGQSGNPTGRPKKRVISELYEQMLSDPAFVADVEDSIRKMIKSGRMVGQLLLKEMTERTEGKVTQPIDVEGSLAITTLSERMQKARERTGR